MVPILLFMVLALAVAGGVLYVTHAREEQSRAEARAGERHADLGAGRDEPADGVR